MGNQFRLPTELMELEAHLRGLVLPESRVDRDQLFYEAGLAAAGVDSKSYSLLRWQLTSGVLAASVLVLSLLWLQRPSEQASVAAESVAQDSVERMVVETIRAEVDPARRPARSWPESASFLILRDAALRMDLPEPKLVATLEEGRKVVSPSISNLLQEYLPQPVLSAPTEERNDQS